MYVPLIYLFRAIYGGRKPKTGMTTSKEEPVLKAEDEGKEDFLLSTQAWSCVAHAVLKLRSHEIP